MAEIPWGPIIAGGASLAGGIIGNRAAAGQAKSSEAFSERMRNTQWQAGVADMEAAGLNPALAYSQGGAASPGGTLAQQGDVISGAVSSAMHAKRLTKELKLMEEQTEAFYNKGRLDSNLAGESAARKQMIFRQQKGQEINNELSNLSLFSARNVAGMHDTKFGKALPYMQSILGMAPRINLIGAMGGRGPRTGNFAQNLTQGGR